MFLAGKKYLLIMEIEKNLAISGDELYLEDLLLLHLKPKP
jgi:hypothetical protein